MNRFQFSLESVLQVKCRLEELALADLAESQGRLIEAQRVLTRIFAEKQQHLAYMSREHVGPLDVTTLVYSQQYRQALNLRLEQQHERVSEIEAEVDEKRQAVVEAQRERKTLESIKEKDWQRFLQEMRQQEQNFSDEVAVNRYGRTGGDSR